MGRRIRRLLAISLVMMLVSADICTIAEAAATLTLPKALKIIEKEAFAGDTSIEKVIIPDGTTEIHSRAFADSAVTDVFLPSSLSSIADDAFEDCKNVNVQAEEGSYAYDWAVRNGYIAEEYVISSLKASMQNDIYTDDTVLWSVQTSGGTGNNTYSFSLYRDGALVSSSEYTPVNFYTARMEEPGTYRLVAVCRDGAGTESKPAENTILVQAPPVKITNIAGPQGVCAVGDTLSWNVETAEGTAPLRYRYELKCSGEVVFAGDYCEQNSFAFTAQTAGVYMLTVDCTDADDISARMTAAPVSVYSPAQAIPAAPELNDHPFASDEMFAPDYTAQRFVLNWDPVEYADSYNLNLSRKEGEQWVSLLEQDSLLETGFTLESSAFGALAGRTLFRLELGSQGLREGDVNTYYFALNPVNENITVNGQKALTWNQNSIYASTRSFSVDSAFAWEASCDAEWITLDMEESILRVGILESDGERDRSASITLSNGASTATISVNQSTAITAPRAYAPEAFSTNPANPSQYPVGEFRLRWVESEEGSTRLRVFEQQADGGMRQILVRTTTLEYCHISPSILGEELKAGSVYAFELAAIYSSSYANCEMEDDLLKNTYYVRMTEGGHRIAANEKTSLVFSDIERVQCLVTASNYFTCSTDSEWLSVGDDEVSDHSDYISISAELNNTGATRTGHVYFTCGTATATVTVIQNDMTPKVLFPENLSQNESSPTKVYMDMNLLDSNSYYFIYRGEDMYLEAYENGAYGEKIRIGSTSVYGTHRAETVTEEVGTSRWCRLTVEYDGYSSVYYVDFTDTDQSDYTSVLADSDLFTTTEASAKASSWSIPVSAETGWTVSSNSSWLTTSVSRGSAGNSSITISAAANTTGKPRTGLLSFKSTSNNSRSWYEVNQVAEDYLALYYRSDITKCYELYDPAVHCTEIFDSSGAETEKFKLYGSDNLRIDCNASWIDVDTYWPDPGEVFTFTLAANPAGSSARTAVVTVSNGVYSQDITIRQAAGLGTPAIVSPALSTDKSNPSVIQMQDFTLTWKRAANAVRYTVDLSGSRDYVAEIKDTGAAQYSCTIPAGLLDAYEKNYLYLNAYDQYGYNTELTAYLMPVSGSAALINGSSAAVWQNASDTQVSEDFVIQSSAGWTASASQSWIRLSAASGASGDTLTVTLAENTGSTARSGNVIVKVGNSSSTLRITQCAYLAEEYPAINAPVYSQDKVNPSIINLNGDSMTFTWNNAPQADYYEVSIWRQKSTNVRSLVAESNRLKNGETSFTFTDLELQPGELYSVRLSRMCDRWKATASSYYFTLADDSAWVLLDGETSADMEEDGDESSGFFKVTASGYWTAQTDSDWILLYRDALGQYELDARGDDASQYSKYSNASGEKLCVSTLENTGSTPRTGSVTVSCGSAQAVITVYQYQNYTIASLASPDLASSYKDVSTLSYGPVALKWNAASGGTGRYMVSLRESSSAGSGYYRVLEKTGLSSLRYTIPVDELTEGMYYKLYLGTEITEGDYSGQNYYFHVNYKNELTPLPSVDWSEAQVGGMVKINASASGGAGDYQFAYELLKDGVKQYITTWENMDYYTFPILSSGSYQVRLYVKDASGAQTSVLSDAYTPGEGAVHSYISLSQTVKAVDDQDTRFEVAVSANSQWSAKTSASWLSVTTAQGAATVKVERNSGASERTGTVTFAAGSKTAVLTVTQAAMEIATEETRPLTLSQSVWNILNPLAASLRLKVNAFDVWTVSGVPEWISVSETSDNGTSYISIYASQNKGITRSATLVFSTGVSTKKFHVVQCGNDVPAKVTSISVSDSSPLTGEPVVFELETRNADEVKVMVDNECYEVLSVVNNRVTFTRSFSDANENAPRIVRFVPSCDGVQGLISDPLEVAVTSSGTLANPEIEPVSRAIVGAGLSLKWKAVENAQSYTLYLYRNGEEVYKKSGLTETEHHIRPEITAKAGCYTVLLMAVARGYSQSQTSAIVDVVVPEASFSIASPGNNAAFAAGQEIDFIVDNPDGYHVALKITDKNGNTTYLPDDQGTYSDARISGGFLFTPAASGSFTAMLMGWPTSVRTGDEDAWFAREKAVTFTVDGPVAKSFVVEKGNANNMFTTSVNSLTLKTNSSVSRVEFYLDGQRLGVYKNGMMVNELTAWDSESGGQRTFTCNIDHPAEGLRKYTARVYSPDGEYSERSYTFYAVTPAQRAVRYPSERDVYLRPTPYAKDSASTLLSLSDELTVRGVFSNMSYVDFGTKSGFVPTAKLTSTRIIPWEEMSLQTAHRSNDFAAYLGGGGVVPLNWTTNMSLSGLGQYRIYKQPESGGSWTQIGVSYGTSFSLPITLLGAGNWRIKISACVGSSEMISSVYDCLFRIFENSGDYMAYMIEAETAGVDYGFYMKGVESNAELIINMHKGFTTGYVTPSGMYVAPLNIEELTENWLANTYATCFGSNYAEVVTGDFMSQLYLVDSMMDSLAVSENVSESGFWNNTSNVVSIVSGFASVVGVTADAINNFKKWGEGQEMRTSWQELSGGLKNMDMTGFDTKTKSGKIHTAGKLTSDSMELINILINCSLKYWKYTQISEDQIRKSADMLRASGNWSLIEVAETIENMCDDSYVFNYCLRTCGISVLDGAAGVARDTIMDILLTHPVIVQAKNGAVLFNNLVFNTDNVQEKAYELSWAVDAADAYLDAYETALKEFRKKPVESYEHFITVSETFIRLVAMEWKALGAFSDAADSGFAGIIASLMEYISSHEPLKKISVEATTLMKNAQVSYRSALDDFYFNCLNGYSVPYKAMKDVVN